MAIMHLKNQHTGTYPYKVREAVRVNLRAIIFDCDGVLMDSEPVHFSAFKKTLEDEGFSLSEEVYKERFLALDDKGAFTTYYKDEGQELTVEKLKSLIDRKSDIFQKLVNTEGVLPFPAVPEFVMAVSQRYPLAIASGARRHELETLLESAGIRTFFEAIVSADDVQNGKPNPESYQKALAELNASGKRSSAIRPEECVVIEDSREGIVSAHLAGMKCIAVTTSYPAFELSVADLIVPSLASLRVTQIEDLFHTPQPLPLPSPYNN